MGLTGCYAVLKYIVFLLNLVFWVSGLAVIFLSVWMLFDPTFYISMTQEESNYYSGVYILFLAGVILFVTGFLGCFGAYKESPKLLILYFCGLLLILVAQISAGIWAFSNKDSLQRLLHHTVTQTIQYEYGKPEYQQRTIAFDAIQKELQCCGADSPADWLPSSKSDGLKFSPTSVIKKYEIPKSCCKPDINEETCAQAITISGTPFVPNENIFSKGCYLELSKKIEEYMNTVVVLTVGIGFIEFFGLIIALILCCAIRAVTKYK